MGKGEATQEVGTWVEMEAEVNMGGIYDEFSDTFLGFVTVGLVEEGIVAKAPWKKLWLKIGMSALNLDAFTFPAAFNPE